MSDHAIIELVGAERTYYKPDGTVMVRALDGIDLTVRKGRYAAIMGQSGSGKSTLMNVIGCLDRLTGGKYLLDGRDCSEMDDTELSQFRGRTIGFVFQAFNLIPELTIEQNVEIPLFYQGVGRAERRERAIASLEAVELEHRLGHRPRELSGGQMQRVAIARALVTEPALLLADEPTGNLDSSTGEAILKLFESLHARGMTIVMVTHDESIGQRCERVIRLSDGRVASDEMVESPALPGS